MVWILMDFDMVTLEAWDWASSRTIYHNDVIAALLLEIGYKSQMKMLEACEVARENRSSRSYLAPERTHVAMTPEKKEYKVVR